MRAKWLWTTWVYVALAAVIALEVLFITFIVIFIVPKFELLVHRGVLDGEILTANAPRMLAFLHNLLAFTDKYTTFLVLLSALAWGLFEWRVRSENKSLIRMSALGTVATGLMLVVWMTAASLLVLFCLGAPTAGKIAKSSVVDQFARIEISSGKLN